MVIGSWCPPLLLRLSSCATAKRVHTSLLIDAPIVAVAVLGSSGKSPKHLFEVCIERIEQHALFSFLQVWLSTELTALDWGFTQIKSPSLGAGAFWETLMKLSYLMRGPQSDPTKYDRSISGALPEASRWLRVGSWSRIDFSVSRVLISP
jgi:hypothetical protein